MCQIIYAIFFKLRRPDSNSDSDQITSQDIFSNKLITFSPLFPMDLKVESGRFSNVYPNQTKNNLNHSLWNFFVDSTFNERHKFLYHE